jgi:hypothetical protein
MQGKGLDNGSVQFNGKLRDKISDVSSRKNLSKKILTNSLPFCTVCSTMIIGCRRME